MQFLVMLFLLMLLKKLWHDSTCLRLVPRVMMPSTSVWLPPLLCYPSPRILPPLFPSIHILASCSAAVPSSSATIIYRPPQSPHRPLLPPLPSPLHCQFTPSASSCSTASFAPATVSFASPPRLLRNISLLFHHRFICCPGPLLHKNWNSIQIKTKVNRMK